MKHFELVFETGTDRPIPAQWAYQLYAALLNTMPADAAQQLHDGGSMAMHQYLLPAGPGKCLWSITTAGEDALAVEAIRSLEKPALDSQGLTFTRSTMSEFVISPVSFYSGETIGNVSKHRFHFLTPTGFKSEGRYALFPTERLILQSLMKRWELFCPEASMHDQDALEMLARNIQIVRYQLNSAVFPLKEGMVQGFTGWVDLYARLSLPMAQLWGALLKMAPYSGIGIKTGLGMGAIMVTARERQNSVTKPTDVGQKNS